MRIPIPLAVNNVTWFKNQLLSWGQQFSHFVYLDSNAHRNIYSEYDMLVAAEAKAIFKIDQFTNIHNAFEKLSVCNDWIFGNFNYYSGRDGEDSSSINTDALNAPDFSFFQPKWVFLFSDNKLVLEVLEEDWHMAESVVASVKKYKPDVITLLNSDIVIKHRVSKATYLNTVDAILQHIKRGDVYEINYCIEFYAKDVILEPESCFKFLNTISQAPFSAFVKQDNQFILSASPERYLKRKDNTVISQPIKGTAKRFLDIEQDTASKTFLNTDLKERSENIMIVDLVRNDLSKTATKGSVRVEELCKVYSYKQVHQLVSTIRSEVEPNCSLAKLISTTFPMGSMTGAPKISAMQLIEKFEAQKRGPYSGAIGYVKPNGDFDFNVVIRSILYNSAKKYISYSVGSAITSKSIPDKEYKECLLKANAMANAITKA